MLKEIDCFAFALRCVVLLYIWNEDGREGNVLFGSLLDDGEERKIFQLSPSGSIYLYLRKEGSLTAGWLGYESVLFYFIFQGLKFLTSLVSLDRE